MGSSETLEPTPLDILILSNGPGELSTWVRPVVRELRRQLGNDRQQVRISVVLSPCPNASGQEADIARSFPEVDRVQAALDFWRFLLLGRTAQSWDWHPQGVVIFLGGDQLFSVIVGKRLGYAVVVYAEWEARWPQWVDRFGVMNPALLDRAPQRYAHKYAVVGDLMAEAQQVAEATSLHPRFNPSLPLIGLLPGSKAAKLAIGLPFCLATAEHLARQRPQIQFVIPVAPTLSLRSLSRFADPAHNPVIAKIKGVGTVLVELTPLPSEESPVGGLTHALQTPSGLRIPLWTEFPAYGILRHCDLCLTTIGANTAELGALAVPMVVLLPTQKLDAMKAWDGILGILANLPGIGSLLARGINWLMFQKFRGSRKPLLAWPNIWARKEIVPELIGALEPERIAALALEYLDDPDRLNLIRQQLRSVRGKPGAARRLVELVVSLCYHS